MDGALHGGLRPTTNSHHLTPQPHGTTRTRNTTGSKAGRSTLPPAENSDHTPATALTEADRWI